MKIKNDKSIEELTYESAYKELLELVDSLESNEHTLDETMLLFERGQLLFQHCAKLLDNAELKIRQLSFDQVSEMEE